MVYKHRRERIKNHWKQFIDELFKQNSFSNRVWYQIQMRTFHIQTVHQTNHKENPSDCTQSVRLQYFTEQTAPNGIPLPMPRIYLYVSEHGWHTIVVIGLVYILNM